MTWKKPCTENPLWGLNQAAKDAQCLVTVIWPGEGKSRTYFTRGFPLTTTSSCEGGVNVKIEFFVPRKEEDKETT